MITDGAQTRDRGDYTDLTTASSGIKNKGVTVFALGIGKSVDLSEVDKIASGGDYVYSAESFRDLEGISSRLKKSLCTST